MSISRQLIKYLGFILLITANIGCDQISKSAAREHIAYHDQIPVIGDNLVLTKVENSGAFLSLGDDMSDFSKSLLLNILPALTLVMLLFWLFRSNLSQGMALALCFIIGGGIGNIFDRIMHGSVTDFLYVRIGIFHTGIFNMADVSITGGVLFLLAYQLLNPKNLVTRS